MQAAADGPAAAAIDLAEMLVEQGMPFRAAHALVGGMVRHSLERHVPLVELVAAHPELGEAAVELLEPGVAVTRRRTPGGAGPIAVASRPSASPGGVRWTGPAWPNGRAAPDRNTGPPDAVDSTVDNPVRNTGVRVEDPRRAKIR